jgi:ribosomal protein L23
MAEKKAVAKKAAEKKEKPAKAIVEKKEAKEVPTAKKEEKFEKKTEAKAEPTKKIVLEQAKFATTLELQNKGIDNSIIFYPLVTEKAVNMIEAQNKLCFIVAEKADKPTIKKTLEAMYGAKIDNVNIVRDMKGRKKAIVKINKKFKADEIAMKLGVI